MDLKYLKIALSRRYKFLLVLGSGGIGNPPGLKNGELPDVNPNAVHVRQPALIGKNGKRSPLPFQQR